MVYPCRFRHICAVIRPGDRRERRIIPASPASSGVRMLRFGLLVRLIQITTSQKDTGLGGPKGPKIYSLPLRDIKANIL